MRNDTGMTPDLFLTAEIVKTVAQDDGSLLVYGACSDDSLDLDGQRADPTWLKGALPEWFNEWGNIREMHQPSAVGVAERLDWKGDVPWLASRVIDPMAILKVETGVYKAYSIGVKNPKLRYDRFAPKGWIVGGTIVETSLVDRPSNSSTRFELAKAITADEVLDVQRGIVIQRLHKSALDENEPGSDGDGDAGETVGGDEQPFGAKSDTVVSSSRMIDFVDGFAYMESDGMCLRCSVAVNDAGEVEYGDPEILGPVEDVEAAVKAAAADAKKSALVEGELKRAGALDAPGAHVPSKEEQVAEHETTEKSADAETVKAVDAPIDAGKAADEEKAADADTAKDAATGDGDAETVGKGAHIELLEKAAAESAFCKDCRKVVKVEDGHEHQLAGGHTMMVGKCADGHELRKYVGADLTKTVEAEKTADADAGKEADAEKAGDVDVEKAAEETKAAGSDTDKSAVEETGKGADSDFAGGDVVKSVVAELLRSAGIDIETMAAKVAEKRLEKFSAALDHAKALAAEVAKSTDVGPHQVGDPGNGQLRTQFVAAVRVVNELAGQLGGGNGRFDLGDGHAADAADLGKADQIGPTETWDLRRAADADITKHAHGNTDPTALVAELAKSLASHMDQAFAPVVKRLEEVEHQTKPAAPPVLTVAERDHTFNKSATAGTIESQAIGKRLSQLSQAERERVLAEVLSSNRGWKS